MAGGRRDERDGWRVAHQIPPDRGTSPIRNSAPLGPYSRTMPRALWKPGGGVCFL